MNVFKIMLLFYKIFYHKIFFCGYNSFNYGFIRRISLHVMS